MIFGETKDGLEIWISDRELMKMEDTHFIGMIMKARHIYRIHADADMENARHFYRMHADADMDDDNSKEE